MLCNDNHPFFFWALLHIPIPEKPVDPVATMFEYLKLFTTNMLKADAQFLVFPHNLSEYELTEDLLELLEDPDQLPYNVDKWLVYFLQAWTRARGSYTYMLVLLGFREPFPKVIKTIASWFWKTKFGLWKSLLQSEKPVALGWLLFSTSNMDKEVLCGKIFLQISSIPVGLCWKMISIGTQGSIPQEQQVKALHLYIDKLDAAQAKPLLMNLYTSKPELGHNFPLQIQMQLVPELDSFLNTKGRTNAEWLRACQNTWLAKKLTIIKTWEIELDHYNLHMKMSLQMAMMSLHHPTNSKFALFHSINWHWIEKCHVLMVFKSAKSQARAMIAGMLPYLQWKYGRNEQKRANSQVVQTSSPGESNRCILGSSWGMHQEQRILATKCW